MAIERHRHTGLTINTRAHRPRPLVIGIPILLAYSIFIGGAPAGELLGVLRTLTAIVAGAMIFAYIRFMPRGHDRVDQAMVVALVCFAGASLFSTFARQSLDALLGCLVYVSAFALARGALRNPAVRSVTGRSLLILSVAVTALVCLRQMASVIGFLGLTGWSTFPPLGLRIDAQPWGHPYDVALLGLMLYPSWFLGRPGRIRIAAATIVGCVLVASVFLMGSRTIWAAALGGLVIFSVPLIGGRWRASGRRAAAIGLGAFVLVAGLIIVAAPSLLSRAFDLGTLGQRGQMWLATVEAWLARPVTGSGPGSFPWVLQQTGYFDANTLAPRHPDNALFQLLPEAGILGLIAVGVILVAIGPRLWRRRSAGARFALGVFAVASLGSNPTDFPYLVAVALIWTAMAAPRARSIQRKVGTRSRVTSRASYASLAIIALAVACMSAAGIAYDLGGRFVDSRDLARAERAFDVAVALDPGMALYWRQRGTVQLLRGDPDRALADLSMATHINPSDDLAWRTLGFALRDAGRPGDAGNALETASSVQRSDPTNLLVSAAWAGPGDSADAILAELVQAWPTLMSAPGWGSVASGPEVTARVADLALRRWDAGSPSLEPSGNQREWLMLLVSADDLLTELSESSDAVDLADVKLRLSVCGDRAATTVRSLAGSYQRFADYWALVLQVEAEQGNFDERAARAYSLIAAQVLDATAWDVTLNPLHENDTRGYSADQWGYRRLPIQWPDYRLELPSPGAGTLRWILDPVGAREQAQVAISDRC